MMKSVKILRTGGVFFQYVNYANNLNLKVYSVGLKNIEKNSSVEFSAKNKYFVCFVKYGEGLLTVDSLEFNIKQSDIFVIFPSFFKSKITTNSRLEYYWFEIGGESAMFLCHSAMLTEKSPVYELQDKDAYKYFYDIELLYKNDEERELNSLFYIYSIFAHIIDEKHQNYNKIISQKENLVMYAKKLILENYSDIELSLQKISNLIYVSPNYLSRIFKEITKMSVSKFILYTRLDEAKVLLSTGIYSIEKVSEIIGFNNVESFVSQFKRYTKLTPNMYVKK